MLEIEKGRKRREKGRKEKDCIQKRKEVKCMKVEWKQGQKKRQ